MSDSTSTETVETKGAKAGEYQVLARKYRPTTFSGLIGQEALVRTLTNAFASNRLHHAFVMTGVRGVGKTSTARIIARALNCIGLDGNGGPTTEPCGACDNCVAIAGDRHVDVLEMDAASNTGVDNIRELIDGVRYRPASARYKVYIIDEVHMLSKSAFNALLKTLEEPPEHVIFIFATTEIRKVPITVLSRCQRFDLRRVPVDKLVTHFADICQKEGAEITDGALHIIARAADGSVRDGLSLLDQAIAHADGTIDDEKVRSMLGLADRTRTFGLLELIFKGEIAQALNELSDQYNNGADPLSVIEDMLELVHWLTKVKVSPESADAPDVPENERTKGKELTETLRMPELTRAWQLLLKGLTEVSNAPSPLAAAEMVLVRLAYAADLPTPGDAVKAMQDGSGNAGGNTSQGSGGAPSGSGNAGTSSQQSSGAAPAVQTSPSPDTSPDPVPTAQIHAQPTARVFANLDEVALRAGEVREGRLQWFIETQLRVVRFEPGHVEINAGQGADRELVQRLKSFLEEETRMSWTLALSSKEGSTTVAENKAADAEAARAEAATHPLVKAVLDTFPGAQVEDVRAVVRPKIDADPAPDEGDDSTMDSSDDA